MKKEAPKDNIWQKYKMEILISLFTSLLWFFVEHIINTVPRIGRNVIETLSNYVYTNAAKFSINIILTMFVSFLVGWALAIVIRPIMQYREIRKLEKEIEVLKTDNNANKKKEDNLSKEYKKETRIDIGRLIVLIVFVFMLYMNVYKPVFLNSSFDLDIKMIKPYTDNKTVMMLESDWTRMKSKDDYDKIYVTINKIKDENNLPKK